jgi:hypothetical protein
MIAFWDGYSLPVEGRYKLVITTSSRRQSDGKNVSRRWHIKDFTISEVGKITFENVTSSDNIEHHYSELERWCEECKEELNGL